MELVCRIVDIGLEGKDGFGFEWGWRGQSFRSGLVGWWGRWTGPFGQGRRSAKRADGRRSGARRSGGDQGARTNKDFTIADTHPGQDQRSEGGDAQQGSLSDSSREIEEEEELV
jgi:hypothetical protein